MGVNPKIRVVFPPNGWWKQWKTLWTNGWFGGFSPYFWKHPNIVLYRCFVFSPHIPNIKVFEAQQIHVRSSREPPAIIGWYDLSCFENRQWITSLKLATWKYVLGTKRKGPRVSLPCIFRGELLMLRRVYKCFFHYSMAKWATGCRVSTDHAFVGRWLVIYHAVEVQGHQKHTSPRNHWINDRNHCLWSSSPCKSYIIKSDCWSGVYITTDYAHVECTTSLWFQLNWKAPLLLFIQKSNVMQIYDNFEGFPLS